MVKKYKINHKKILYLFLYPFLLVYFLFIFFDYLYTKDSVDKKAKTFVQNSYISDLSFRRWIASHNGVYVKVTENTPPSPHLAHIENRDITMDNGTKLTLMNPFYAFRQLKSDFDESLGANTRLTGLRYLNENNKPDDWEKKQLKYFEATKKDEIFELVEDNNTKNYRYMKALMVEADCLRCHAHKGFLIGDYAGGISISVPYDSFYLGSIKGFFSRVVIYTIVFALILIIFIFVFKKTMKKEEELIHKLFEKDKEIDKTYHLFDVGNVVILKWKRDSNWSLEYISKNVKNVLGYTKDEFLSGSVNYIDILHEDDKDNIIKKVKSSIKSNFQNFMHKPYRLISKDGKEIWVSDTTQILRDDDGNITHFVGYLMDITNYKNTQKQLSELEDRFQLAIDSTKDGLWDWNISTNEVFFSQKWKSVLGYEDDEVSNKFIEWEKLVHPDDILSTLEELNHHIFGHTDYYENEHRLRHKDGHWLWMLGRGKALFDENGKAYRMIGFHTDITATKQLEENLRNLNENLEKEVQTQLQELREKEQILIQQSKLATMGEMIGNIAHQWRQPLNSLSLKKDILIDSYYAKELNDDEVDEFDNKVDDLLQYMSKTIDDFRNFFVPTKEKVYFDLLKSVDEILNIVSTQLQNHQIKLVVNNNDNNAIELLGYPNEFKQVIINLINNSKDAIMNRQSKKEIIDGEILIDLHFDNRQNIEVIVKDNGGGIPQDILNKIFEPYFTTKFKSQGTGLGLYMSKTIIEKNMNGSLLAENIDDGAKFIIKLDSAVNNAV
jgi:PAS domain S-box-containing protein